MILSKDLKWLEEYIEASSSLLPSLHKLKRVNAVYGRPNTKHKIYGQLWKYKSGTYRMSLYVHYFSNSKKKHYSSIDILCTLAHELAHLEHWDHTPEHKTLEAMITVIFMGKLKSTGYVSQERELENIK